MKKLLFVLAAAVLALPSLSQAAALPGSATLDFRVINISNANQNAESAGVRPGDVLRYEVELTSNTEDVNEYVAQIDVSGFGDSVELVDLGLGVREGNFVVYPPYSSGAPCRQVYTFFGRFKGCDGNVSQLSSSIDGESVLVPTTCDAPVTGTRLPSSGPAIWTIIAFLMMIGIFCGHQMIRQT